MNQSKMSGKDDPEIVGLAIYVCQSVICSRNTLEGLAKLIKEPRIKSAKKPDMH